MTYTFFWLTGKREVLEGISIESALNNAGFVYGAVRALDFWSRNDNYDYDWNAKTREWDMTPEARIRIFGEKM